VAFRSGRHCAVVLGRRGEPCARSLRRAWPYEESEVGHEAIQAFWLDDEGETFTVTAEPVAVEGDTAVVRVTVRYGEPVRQEYRDLRVLRFAADGRVEDYEEWA